MIKAQYLNKFDYSISDMDSVKARKKTLSLKGNDPDLLSRCEAVWNNLDQFRRDRARSLRFCYGDQWGDIIEVNGRPHVILNDSIPEEKD